MSWVMEKPPKAQSATEYVIGDIVSVISSDGEKEGIVANININEIEVEVGDSIISYPIKDCSLILKANEYELHDVVQVRPQDEALYYNGTIIKINSDGTFDILLEGDDLEDIEKNVKVINIRKLMSRRTLAFMRWKKAINAVVATHRMQSSIK